jgi:hypothetical protein
MFDEWKDRGCLRKGEDKQVRVGDWLYEKRVGWCEGFIENGGFWEK